MTQRVIGVDFDNTIVTYDDLFYRVADQQGLIPSALQRTKSAVRAFLRGDGREDDWTELQGYVYGERMTEAAAFPGALECLAQWVAQGLDVYIVSHKTRHPYRGPAYDLHDAARRWLEQHGVVDDGGIGLSRAAVYFELSKQKKIERISQLGCSHFIDDLPEILVDLGSLNGIRRILFDPGRQARYQTGIRCCRSWTEIAEQLELNETRSNRDQRSC